MPFVVCDGQRRWWVSRDDDGGREFHVVHRVEWREGTGTGELGYGGPNAALHADGLPVPGDAWVFPDDAEDVYAYCRQRADVRPVIDDGEPTTAFDVEQIFSTRADTGRCKTAQEDNPLNVLPVIAITFANYNEQPTHDRFGLPIQYSSHEPVAGPVNEWPADQMAIRITVNVESVSIPLLWRLNNTVNDAVLWGFPRRTLKLKIEAADEQYFGSCEKYVRLVLTFSPAPDGKTWDRDVRDVGSRCLIGHWHPRAPVWVTPGVPACGGGTVAPNPFNPSHYQAAVGRDGNPLRQIVLNGAGVPYNPDPFAYSFQGTAAEAKAEADSVRAAYLGPYGSEAAANAACCITGTGTGTSPRFPGEQPRQVYVSIYSQRGDPLEDPTSWCILTDQVSPIAGWSDGVFYTRGSPVFLAPFNYIAVADNINVIPGTEDADGVDRSWVELPGGLNDLGDWTPSHIYGIGDYVREPLPPGTPAAGTGTDSPNNWWCISGAGDVAPGVVHIERYRESHFQDLPRLPTEL